MINYTRKGLAKELGIGIEALSPNNIKALLKNYIKPDKDL